LAGSPLRGKTFRSRQQGRKIKCFRPGNLPVELVLK
jgi:hypothetical protein